MADGLFVDVRNPQGRLKDPGEPPNDGLVSDLQDALSWIGWIDQILDAVFEFSFTRLIVDQLGLNYQRLRPIASTWNNVSYASGDVQDNISAGLDTVGPQWNGNAAMAFEDYMERWVNTLGDNELACVTVRDALVEIADEIGALVEVVIGFINLCTSILEFPGIAPLKLAWNSADIVKGVKAITELKDTVKTVIDFVERMMHAANGDGTLDIPEVNVTVPDKPYDNPLD